MTKIRYGYANTVIPCLRQAVRARYFAVLNVKIGTMFIKSEKRIKNKIYNVDI